MSDNFWNQVLNIRTSLFGLLRFLLLLFSAGPLKPGMCQADLRITSSERSPTRLPRHQALGNSALPVGRTPAGRTARKSRPCCDRTAAAACDLA
ncbi:hypothetical protein BQ8482_130180 [Mesorhizobium delmotii]|uniref:Uncharacterized protein n=1 Tax=Mesorhizobium delmotii TaxID=1631247 RepID=A0A2P9AGM0_9HYPH|nr:hypothetical protein BQ8482_130180 [Mesorhizobium delmotii]